jgi:hypothetical protein
MISIVTFDVPSGGAYPETIVMSINSSGVCCGYFYDAAVNFNNGFIRAADGTQTTFSYPSATNTYASSIADDGTVAGWYVDSGGTRHGFFRSPAGVFTSFDAPGAGTGGGARGTTVPDARALNNAGDVAGYYTDNSNVLHGFLRLADGTFTTFDAPSLSNLNYAGSGLCVNASSVLAAAYSDATNLVISLIDSGGTFATFQDPSAGTSAYQGTGVYSIDDTGKTAGTYVDSGDQKHLFIRSADGTTFTNFEGTVIWLARGTSGAAAGSVTSSGLTHGFYRAPDGTITLFDVPGADQTNGFGSQPQDINASGVMCGIWIDSDPDLGLRHGFIATVETDGPPDVPPLRYKLVPLSLDFANTTWDQANRLAMYELYRSDGLDPLDPFLVSLFEGLDSQLWDPPKTLTIQVFADAVDDSWNILKRPLDGSGNVTPLQGKRITIDPSVDEEWAGDWEVVRASYNAFQPSNAASGGGDPSMPSGVAGIARPNDQSGGTITLTLRSYDERWLSLDTSQTASYANLPLPIHDDEMS